MSLNLNKARSGGRTGAVPMMILPSRDKYDGRMIAVNTERIFDTAFAGRIRAARLRRGWSLSQLAERSGVTKERLLRAERQPWRVRLNDLNRIAETLETELAEFSESVFVRIEAPERRT
jgi:ribosome-binding protein aMBF1 (putative translation factor)